MIDVPPSPSAPPPLSSAFARWPRFAILALGLGGLAVIGAADRASAMFSMAALYLLPPAFVAWYAGRPLGVATGIVAGIVWGLAALASRSQTPNAITVVWNLLMFSGSGVSSAVLAGTLRKTLHALRASLTREQELARVDALTGARNLRAFRELLEPELLRVRRYKRPCTVVFLDADGFKAVNDTHGHAIGDRALMVIAQTLSTSLRRTDVIARLGGDEFGLILTDTGPADAEAVLRKALVRMRDVMAREGWKLTMSAGAVACLQGNFTVDDVVRQADALMFDVKRNGKNDVRIEAVDGRPDTVTPPTGQPLV